MLVVGPVHFPGVKQFFYVSTVLAIKPVCIEYAKRLEDLSVVVIVLECLWCTNLGRLVSREQHPPMSCVGILSLPPVRGAAFEHRDGWTCGVTTVANGGIWPAGYVLGAVMPVDVVPFKDVSGGECGPVKERSCNILA
jgi:hypothetical protein